MSDILIAQEVGTVVVIETAPAEIVEVVAAGPQGPVGDVNPQMPVILAATEAARDAALVSELAAAASQSAAATSAANAATSESNAATSAATATAQATASAGSATASAGSAAAAQASATNAANSEANAANSATASANSATSSANSATAAQAAQTATESARDTTLATIGTAALKANNLSDLASIPTALVNLGLNNVSNTSDANKPISTATQAALNLKADAASPTTTGTLTHSGDIVLSGSGKRITGDFSNATVANRVMFQTSAVNSSTQVGALPTGTNFVSTFTAYGNQDSSQAPFMVMGMNGTDSGYVAVGRTGAAGFLPMTFYTGGSERMRIDTGGNVGIGTTSTVAKLEVNGGARVGSSVATSYLRFAHDTANGFIDTNTGSIVLQTGSTNRLVIDASGGVTSVSPAGLGYGTGAGGTVTQATSKSTAVTLNKPTGQITMHDAALAAGARVIFGVTNSYVSDKDVVIASYVDDFGAAYRVDVQCVWAGYFQLGLTNVTAGSLSQAVRINFAIIKGAVT